jgi:hypothetical protein
MARSNHSPFWTHDTVAAAVLAGVGAASLQIKLDALADELNIPMLTACIHAWPMVLIFAGLALLLVQSAARDAKKDEKPQAARTLEILPARNPTLSAELPRALPRDTARSVPTVEIAETLRIVPPFGPDQRVRYGKATQMRAREESAGRSGEGPAPLPQTSQEWDAGVVALEGELQRQLDLAVGGTEV